MTHPRSNLDLARSEDDLWAVIVVVLLRVVVAISEVALLPMKAAAAAVERFCCLDDIFLLETPETRIVLVGVL